MSVHSFKLTKSVSEVYNLQIDSHRCAWATITINDCGDFNAITDCGNFNYSWRGYGSGTFKDFLIRIFSKAEGRSSYVYGKLSDSNRDEVDCKETIEPMKKEFIEKYRELYHDKRKNARYIKTFETKWAFQDLQYNARATWDVLQELENEGNMSQDRFLSALWHDGRVHSIFFDGDYLSCLDLKMTGDRQAITFCEVVAPVFVEALKQEVQAIEGEVIKA